MKRIYKSGSKWAVWRWAESPLLYMKRCMLLHTPWGGVMLNFISLPDPWPDQHDHPANFWSFILQGWYMEYRGSSKNVYTSLPRYYFGFDWWLTGRGFTSVACVNRMVASDALAHTIYDCHPDTLTLVFYGPRRREWGYHTPYGWVGWREYSKEINHAPDTTPGR